MRRKINNVKPMAAIDFPGTIFADQRDRDDAAVLELAVEPPQVLAEQAL